MVGVWLGRTTPRLHGGRSIKHYIPPHNSLTFHHYNFPLLLCPPLSIEKKSVNIHRLVNNDAIKQR